MTRALATILLFAAAPVASAGDKANQVAFDALERCLEDRAGVSAVFNERFPHLNCLPDNSCDPRLVQSAKTLARQRCRVRAMDDCVASEGTAEACLRSLNLRWQSAARNIRDDLQKRWKDVDRDSVSRFAVRRFERDATWHFGTGCEEIGLAKHKAVPEALLCDLSQSLSDVTRMEGLASYMNAQVQGK